MKQITLLSKEVFLGLTLIVGLASFPVFAQTDSSQPAASQSATTEKAAASTEKASDELRQLLKQAEALKGKFEQRQYDSDGHLLQTTQGSFAVQRPGNFYWESLPPFEQLIVSNSDRLWVYDPDLEQVTVHNQQQRDQTSPAQLLSGELADLEDKYQISMESQGETRRFTLVSTSDDSMVESLQLIYENGQLSGLQFIDNLGQVTELEFSEVEVNPSLEPGLFQFKVPEGVDVIVND